MGILEKLKLRKKKDKLDEPRFPSRVPEAPYGTRHPPAQRPQPPQPPQLPPSMPPSSSQGSLKAEMDLVLSQMENLRMQYEAINSRLQNIEKVVTEIRGFCD